MVTAGMIWLVAARVRRAIAMGRRVIAAAAVLAVVGHGGAEADDLIVPAFDPAVDVTDISTVAYRGAIPAPMWTSYALTDALFWGRDNQAASRPLVVSADSGAPLISAQDLQFPWSEGVRGFYGQRNPCECGWEVGYFGVYGQSATQFVAVTPPDFLQMPQPIGSDLTADGESATVKYQSVINSAEANVFRTWTEYRETREAWLTVDWLAGFRYVGVEESSSITAACCVGDITETPVRYGVRTRNNMFGGQIGSRARLTWQRWAFEGWAKAGILGNAAKQIQDPLVDYLDFQQRPALSATGGDVGFIGDINLSVIYRLTDVWGIRAGYNTVWIGGLALAPNQYDFATTSTAGTGLASGDGIFLNGANLGLEARW